MNHKWKPLPDEKPDGLPVHKNWECKVCGCKKTLGQYRYAYPTYERNDIEFEKYGPDCIDEAAENLKTID